MEYNSNSGGWQKVFSGTKTDCLSINAKKLENVRAIIATSPSLQIYQLENLREVFEEANFSYGDLIQLEALTRRRLEDSIRNLGWHSGFKDMLELIFEFREALQAA